MNMELAKTIGAAARTARARLKLTQRDIADRVSVSVEFYARIERGTSLPSIVTFARIVSGLGVSADVLLGVAQSSPRKNWTVSAPDHSAERRLTRQIRKASILLKELERSRS